MKRSMRQLLPNSTRLPIRTRLSRQRLRIDPFWDGDAFRPAPSRPAAPRRFAAVSTSAPLWKDADPDIPILKKAKAEYAKLQ